jgi:hypothetical protein
MSFTCISTTCPPHATAADQGAGRWNAVPARDLAPFLVHEQHAHPFRALPVAFDDARITASFARYGRAQQHEYAYHYHGRAWLEPDYGFVVRGARDVVVESMPHYWEVGLPPPPDTFSRRYYEPAVISLRDYAEANYYHFYDEVLGRLELLHRLELGAELPLLIGPGLAAQPFFHQFLQRSRLSQRRWLIHDAPLVVDRVIFAKPLPHQRRIFDWALGLLSTPPDPSVGRSAGRRVFLTRSARRGRFLENNAAVAEACAAFGFETVDADTLNLDAQIALFGAAQAVVAIHGAGLTNLIYRRGAPLALLELFPPDNIPPHYFWLSHAYGYGYDALVGTAGRCADAFAVDTAQLQTRLAALLRAVL